MLECDRISVWEYKVDETGRLLCCRNLWDASTGEFGSCDDLDDAGAMTFLDALQEQVLLVINDVSTDPRCEQLRNAYVPTYSIKSMLDASFLYDGELAGVLCAEQVGDKRNWTTEEQHFCSIMASMLSVALERDKRHEAEQALISEKERYQQLAYSSPDWPGRRWKSWPGIHR